MSFSQEVKRELSLQINPARHCMLAELAAIIAYNSKVITSKGKNYLILSTENIEVARKYFTLLKKTFNIKINLAVKSTNNSRTTNIYSIIVNNKETIRNVLMATKLIIHPNCCKRAFIRGAFLVAGSISNPNKTYHLEFVFANLNNAEFLQEILMTFNLEGKIIKRKKYYIVYIKEGSQIVDILNVMEAHVSLMKLENIRILKDMRNTINRQVNCETANIGKTVVAASKQIDDIKLIDEQMGFTSLPKGLEAIARLRLDNTSASLNELGAMLTPQLSRSGVNHRLRKLSEIANQLRDEEEE
ncbi:MAG TPA: DNA-binding protein WhiA [Clostridiales bacterium]|nr:DNA-binding protein WhiA [Clostridiales bacterium]